MFFRKNTVRKTYDRDNQKPVLKCSICNGEQVAGFLNVHNNVFVDVMLIRDHDDLERFKAQYGISEEIEKIY